MLLPRASSSLEYFLSTKTMFLVSSRYHMLVFSFISAHAVSVFMLHFPALSRITKGRFFKLLERFFRMDAVPDDQPTVSKQ